MLNSTVDELKLTVEKQACLAIKRCSENHLKSYFLISTVWRQYT